jgi:predicted flap endonuclease-1-like 5' DNA nuclease
MAWFQENYVIAVVGLVVAVVLLWFLFGRKKPEDVTPTVAPPTEPKKPLEAVKPEIVAAEPARFKPKEPAPAPAAPVVPTPAPAPVVEAAPPAAAPVEPEPQPAPPKTPPAPAEPVVEAEPAPAPAPEPEPEPTPEPEPAAAPEPAPAVAKADNLQLIKGLGPKLAGLLNGLGVTSFQQIADWTDADIAAIDPQLGAFQGRIARDNFVDQAGYLARGDKAGFEAKYGALGGEL